MAPPIQQDVAINVNVFTKNMQKAAQGLKKFQFQFLGLMFFGQSLEKTFGSMLKPAAELFGLFDLFSLTLQTVFLPAMEAIFEPLMNVLNWFMDLPEGVKMAIGMVALFGLGIGKLFGIVGQMSLGLQSLVLAFGGPGGLLSVIKVAGSALSGLLPILLIVGAAIAFAIIAWRTNLGGFRDFVQESWNSIKEIISGVMDIIKGAVTGDFELISLGVEKIWKNLAVILVNTIVTAINMVKNIFFNLLGSMTFSLARFITMLSKIPGLGFLKSAAENVASFAGGFKGVGEATNLGRATVTTGENGRPIIDFSPVFNINVSDKAELERILIENAKKQVDELRRLTTTGG